MKKVLFLLLSMGLLAGCGEAGDMADAHPGESIYNRSCFSCHAGGVGGAPVPGDEEAWAPRVAKGMDAMVASVRDGMPPGMPPMGLCMTCTDEDFAVVIDFMLNAN